MTKNEREIMKILRLIHEINEKWWLRPIRIGTACGIKDGQRSSWACRHLRKLFGRGFVSRKPPGVYAITEAGLTALEEK